MKKSLFLLLILVFAGSFSSFSQGCSDAGICTAGNLGGKNIDFGDLKNEIRFTPSIEMGEKNTLIFNPQVLGRFMLNSKGYLNIKIPFLYAQGDLGSSASLGDIHITADYSVFQDYDEKWNIGVSGGFRFASGNANQSIDGKVLPMPYQASLGTHDLLTGISVSYTSWTLTSGFQLPLVHQNKNTYQASDWPNNTAYFSAQNLRRKADVMGRIEKSFGGDSWLIAPSVLAIYHLANDIESFPDTSLLYNIDRELLDSKGLTLNLVLRTQYQINDKFRVSLTVGAPVVTRANRPDGLTRAWVLQPSLSYGF